MNKIMLALGSRMVWTGIIVFGYFGLTGVAHVFPSVAWLNDLIGLFGFVLMTYFHVNPSQSYSQPQ